MLPNLQPGVYRFVARAVAASGRRGPSSVSVAFTILRPWWWRPWAVALWILVSVGTLALAYQVRVRQLLAIELVRTRIASDLHDDLGASLSRMVLLSDVARGPTGAEREKRAIGALGEIGATARSLVDHMSDTVWSADPRHDTVADVIGRAAWFGAELFELRGTTWRCSVPDDVASTRVEPDAKRDLLLLLKEALNNIAKHAQASQARLDARLDGSHLVIDIADDGRGFERSVLDGTARGAAGGHGLSNMQTRAREMRGTVEICSSPGQGCRIRIRVPYTAPTALWRRPRR